MEFKKFYLVMKNFLELNPYMQILTTFELIHRYLSNINIFLWYWIIISSNLLY
jgi:hypothetical protein